MTQFSPQRTAEEISTATTEIIVVEGAALETGQTPLQTERINLKGRRGRARKVKVKENSGIEMTTMRDRAAGVSTADHLPGLGAVVVHPHGITNQEISPRRGGVKSNEKSRVMERSGDDPAVGDDLGKVLYMYIHGTFHF